MKPSTNGVIDGVGDMAACLTPLQVFKCLAEGTRLTVVQLLAQMEELCVCELIWLLEQRAMPVSQPKVSRHLAQLRDAGLLTSQRRGQWVHYRLPPDLPAWCHQILTTLCQANAREVSRWVAWLETMPNRPVRCC